MNNDKNNSMHISSQLQKIYLYTFIFITVVISAISLYLMLGRKNTQSSSMSTNSNNSERAFLSDDLATNTSISSIDLDEIIGGGPGKDGIPALSNPSFTSVDDAGPNITDNVNGIVVKVNSEVRYYPYNILVWHEIVNDIIQGQSIVISFCPLCGSAVVFDPTIDGEVLTFGVSGKLYESNLLMYDNKTESLWSQILGEAVVGDFTEKKLELKTFQIFTFGELKVRYPDAKILSEDTGFNRDYSFYPYGDYDTNERIFYPVSVDDKRLPAKEIMYIVNVDEKSVAFVQKDLREIGIVELTVDSVDIKAEVEDDKIFVKRLDTDEVIPGYFAMWFSWATHHQEDGVVWSKDSS